jgi:hypothetical protein
MPTLNPSISVEVDNAVSGVNSISYLQPTSFKLSIDRKHYPNLELFCQSVLHPSMSLNPIEVPIKRLGSIPFAGDKLTFGELTAIIIVDENLNAYTEMYNWMDRLVDTNDRTPLNRTAEVPPTYSDVSLSILSSHNNTTRVIKYLDCIPTSLGDMALESTSGDIQFITFPVTFRFSYFQLT